MTNIKLAMLLETLLGHLNIPLICVILFGHVCEWWAGMPSQHSPSQEFLFMITNVPSIRKITEGATMMEQGDSTPWPQLTGWSKQKAAENREKRMNTQRTEREPRLDGFWVLASGGSLGSVVLYVWILREIPNPLH